MGWFRCLNTYIVAVPPSASSGAFTMTTLPEVVVVELSIASAAVLEGGT